MAEENIALARDGKLLRLQSVAIREEARTAGGLRE
jgi:hypothetical protein